MNYLERELWLTPLLGPMPAAMRLVRHAGFADYMLYERDDRWTYAGGSVLMIAVDHRGLHARGIGMDAHAPGDSVASSGGPADVVAAARLLEESSVPDWRAYGWLAFEAGGTTPSETPQLCLTVPQVEVRLDEAGHALLRATDAATLDRLASVLLEESTDTTASGQVALDLQAGGAAYQELVSRAVSQVQDTELRKVIVSRRIEVDKEIDLAATYEAGRSANSPARSYLFAMGGLRAAGFSPETVVEIDRRVITTHVLAGTRATGSDQDATDALRDQLLGDAKEVHEHAITVADALTDFAQVCAPDSAAATRFMKVVRRGSVQHLASTLRGELAEHVDPWAALCALFPPAAATGVPRRAALDTIRRLEERERGLYGGAVIACDAHGGLDAALALRTVFQRNGRTWLQAGAGVTSGSDPRREFEETCEKLRSVAPFLVPTHDAGSKAD
ncbi:salicylate synthase [Streptomyces sp. NPDC020681]|uniref:salicylate synthase n=1 Tax=Streptomyces sp. NPDC020681 TaxID=3365083 RepID=UPI0037AC24FA